MRITGYALVGLGALIALYVVTANLFVDVQPAENAGQIQGGAMSSHLFWFALIPAVGAMAAGAWMAVSGGKGYRETYNMSQQAT